MNRLSVEKRAQILGLLVEGNSLRAASRLADVSINTVTKLLVDVGQACSDYQDKALRGLSCSQVQCDEIWSFCYAKQKNVSPDMPDGTGDLWTWTAIDAESRLMISWMVGKRDLETARLFMQDLASRLVVRPQITSDGHLPYVEAIEESFGMDVDFGMLVKKYGTKPGDKRHQYLGADRTVVTGNPQSIGTSYVERANLTMRTNIKRFTRKTNAFSKKVDNHILAVSLHFMYYNFARIHKTLRMTPAMQAGISDHVWSLEEIVQLPN
ncbi:MAG: IS1 family transposase [Proteobacteria bacterium]|nr:IS1 family transposase [Bacteroidota bacterium]NBX86166.1 IS1 family transposase [Pseudomonadota bacterium]